MIGKISGVVDYVADDHVLIETAGVGYVVHCASSTLRALGGPGQGAVLYTEMVVREDLMQLFGFRSVAEREWHRLLTSVQGVGAKASLAILDTLGLSGISRALATGDATMVRQAQGVGPKLAMRIVTELKGKAPALMVESARDPVAPAPAPVAASAPAAPRPAPDLTDEVLQMAANADAVSALVNLGYDRADAADAVARAGDQTEAQPLIKAALRLLDQAR